jgi:hypothetical protein
MNVGRILGLLFIVAVCLVCALWAVVSGPQQSPPTVVSSARPSATGTAPASANDLVPATPSANGATMHQASRWVYPPTGDALRQTDLACIRATNRLDFPFPYQGGSSAEFCFRRRGGERGELEAYVSVSRGQFVCHASDCSVALKVDDRPVVESRGDPAADGSSDIIFLRRASQVRQRLQRAGRFIIEATFYRSGTRQMVFEGAQGLVWPPSRASPRP